MTIAADAREHHYSPPSGANVTRSSPRGRRRDDAQRLQARLRLSRQEWERHPAAIALGVPDGSVRAASPEQWKADCRAHPDFAALRSDGWTSAMRVVDSLANRTDWQLGTARPTWDVVAKDARLKRRQVARYIAMLRAAGLLGVVATGRTAAATPMALDDGINAAAVYVLTVPHALQLVIGRHPDQDHAEPSQDHPDATPPDPTPALTSMPTPVDEHDTPSPSPLVTGKDKPTHAREQSIHELASSPSELLGDLTRAQLVAAGQPFWDLSKNPLGTEPHGASNARTSPGRRCRLARFQAAAELVRIDPVLGRISVRHLAALCLEWHLAQFTPFDIRHALHYRPDGTPWPHELTVADVAAVPGWFRYRMAAWRQNPQDPTSPPATSPSSRVLADQTLQRARARARAEREETLQAHRAAPNPAMAAAKAQLAARQLTRKHRQP